MISIIDVDAEGVATEVIVAVNGNIPISGSPSFLSGKAGELDLVVWCMSAVSDSGGTPD